MHRASRRWSWLVVLVVLALVLPALASGAWAQEGEKILRVHHLSYPDVVDPQKSSFTAEIDILLLAYEGLTRLNASQETIPARRSRGCTTTTLPRSPSRCGPV